MYVVRGHLFHRAPRERYQVKAKRRVSNSQVRVWGGEDPVPSSLQSEKSQSNSTLLNYLSQNFQSKQTKQSNEKILPLDKKSLRSQLDMMDTICHPSPWRTFQTPSKFCESFNLVLKNIIDYHDFIDLKNISKSFDSKYTESL